MHSILRQVALPSLLATALIAWADLAAACEMLPPCDEGWFGEDCYWPYEPPVVCIEFWPGPECPPTSYPMPHYQPTCSDFGPVESESAARG